MNTNDTQQDYQPQSTDVPGQEITVEPLSVSDKLIGILTEPSSTYENVRLAGPRASDWLVPLIVLLVIILAGTFVMFSNETFVGQIREMSIESIQEQVRSGAMSQERADEAISQMDRFSGMQRTISLVGVLIGFPIVFFIIAFIYWLFVKVIFKGEITYGGILAVYGLTAYIGVIDQIVRILLMYITGNALASFTPALFMDPDFASKGYRLMASLNPISIWSYVILGIGFHKVASISKGKAFGIAFGLWIVWILISTLVRIPGFGGM